MNTNDRIIKLREHMAMLGLDACIVMTQDPHGSEYPADHWKLREYLSGFNGSAGTLVVTRNHAGLWTDSRYYLQAEKQLRGTAVELHKDGMPGVPDPISYLTYLLPSGSTVGVDGFTISVAEYRSYKSTLENFGINLRVDIDLASELFIWRPKLPQSEVWLVDKKYEGLSRREKVAEVRKLMAEQKATHYLIASLDDIAWLTNMRGSDVEYNPVFYAYMIVTLTEEHLYIDPHKLTTAVSKQLEDDGIIVSKYEHYERNLGNLPADARVYFDPQRANARNFLALPKACVRVEGPSLVLGLKACKTTFEIERIREAHVRDGVALVRFVRWLEQSVGKVRLTEMDVSNKLTSFRAQVDGYISDSFENIVAYGPNAAIVHYAPTIEGAAALEPQGLLLVDSGGQYNDGTTDITRTIALGEVSDVECLHYTLVLKGHIALAQAVFPEGTKGIQLDALARQNMWRFGVDYGHGTGHGVGYCLNVHEGPQSISKKDINATMKPGMLTSDEPGIYVEGSHGIRTENLTICIEAKRTDFGRFFALRTITMFPIDKKPILVDMLTASEIKWLNDYHQDVFDALAPRLEPDEIEWLREACLPIG